MKTRLPHCRNNGDAPSLFGLAPGGACPARPIAGPAVRSYRTFSPLPRKRGGLFSVALSLGLLRPGVTRRRVSMEPGLSSTGEPAAAVRPSGASDVAAWGRSVKSGRLKQAVAEKQADARLIA